MLKLLKVNCFSYFFSKTVSNYTESDPNSTSENIDWNEDADKENRQTSSSFDITSNLIYYLLFVVYNLPGMCKYMSIDC